MISLALHIHTRVRLTRAHSDERDRLSQSARENKLPSPAERTSSHAHSHERATTRAHTNNRASVASRRKTPLAPPPRPGAAPQVALAAASIGQVHAARLYDDSEAAVAAGRGAAGRRVVVKVTQVSMAGLARSMHE